MKKIALIFIVFTVLTIIMTESIQADELGKRWEDAFEKELKNAVLMYEKGYEVPKPQLYELGRTYLLRELHSTVDRQFDEGKISRSEQLILKTMFSVLIHNNPPGGADLTKIPGIPAEKPWEKPAKSRAWKANPEGIAQADVEKFLVDNEEKLGISDSVITFLVRAPFAWNALANRLTKRQAGVSWQDETAKLAKATNTALINSGSLMENGSADEFATQVPPSIRVDFIDNLAMKTEPSPQSMINSMLAFKQYGETYGIHGWRGITQEYLKNDWKKEEEATIEDFRKFLQENHVLLKEVKLGDHASDPLKSASEEILNSLFTNSSIFVVN